MSDLTLLQVMALPRKQRRALAKLNGVEKIRGSMKPYVEKKASGEAKEKDK